jgi:hypothetical protein
VPELGSFSIRIASRLSAHLTIYRNDIHGVPQPRSLRRARVLHAQEMRLPGPVAEPQLSPRGPSRRHRALACSRGRRSGLTFCVPQLKNQRLGDRPFEICKLKSGSGGNYATLVRLRGR